MSHENINLCEHLTHPWILRIYHTNMLIFDPSVGTKQILHKHTSHVCEHLTHPWILRRYHMNILLTREHFTHLWILSKFIINICEHLTNPWILKKYPTNTLCTYVYIDKTINMGSGYLFIYFKQVSFDSVACKHCMRLSSE